MRLIYSILENLKFWLLLGLGCIMVLFVFTTTTYYYYPNIEDVPEETNALFDFIYFTLEGIIVLSFCVSAYNDKVHTWVRPLAIFGGAYTIIKMFNEVLYILKLAKVNSLPLLFIELIITLIILWRISKHYHSL